MKNILFRDDQSLIGSNWYILSKKLIDLGKWYDKNAGKYLQTFPWTNEIDTYSDLRVMEYIVKNLKDFL